MKLDRSRPFGVVFGDRNGIAYEQDGALFDIQDNLVGGAKPAKAAKAPKAAPVPEAPADVTPDAQLDAQLEA